MMSPMASNAAGNQWHRLAGFGLIALAPAPEYLAPTTYDRNLVFVSLHVRNGSSPLGAHAPKHERAATGRNSGKRETSGTGSVE